MKSLTNLQLDRSVIDWPVYMGRALQLAQNVLTATPNPRVGCVLVEAGKIVGEGWHKAAGQDHAEVMALLAAGDRAAGATAFVSLEPCAHQGRTGPCCDALAAAGVARVVIASVDPNPAVAGQGVSKLEAAGIEVYQLIDMDPAARKINPGYFKRRETGLPFVRLKLAMSLDGRTALANGQSQWITGDAARADVQRLRASSSAVLTGVMTVLADNPALTVRADQLAQSSAVNEHDEFAAQRQPLRVILDSQLRTPGTARIITEPGAVTIYVLSAELETDQLPDNVEVKQVMAGERGVDLQSVLESLARDFECNELLVEAGATLSGEFIRLGLVDELVVYIAPRLIGSDGKALLEMTGLTELAQSESFAIKELLQVGSDLRLVLEPANDNQERLHG
jgi:diaminohydroxyphosphoribosylaminopyrimidine deaminase / 5-amino-6-(5-phosphoribosylamino)uracil reductase